MTHGAHWLYRAAVRQILAEGGRTHSRTDGCADATTARIRFFVARKDSSWKTRSLTLWPEGPLPQPRGSSGPAPERPGLGLLPSPPSAQNHRLQPRARTRRSSPPPSTYPARGSLHWQVAGEAEREKTRGGFHSLWCHRAHPSRASRAFSPAQNLPSLSNTLAKQWVIPRPQPSR